MKKLIQSNLVYLTNNKHNKTNQHKLISQGGITSNISISSNNHLIFG